MKIFISWSGKKSCMFAEALKPWLEQVLPGTDVWLSSEDIDKGTIWFTEIINELSNCNCEVLCVTRENFLAPWIHFEAGGMIKGLGKQKVAAILLDIDYGELKQPLNQFNGLRMNKTGARHLVKSFNKVLERPIKESVVERSFEAFWPELKTAYYKLFPHVGDLNGDKKDSYYIVPPPNSNSVREIGSTFTCSDTKPIAQSDGHLDSSLQSSPESIPRKQRPAKGGKKKRKKKEDTDQLYLFDCE